MDVITMPLRAKYSYVDRVVGYLPQIDASSTRVDVVK
jgi:hypothetical protein